MGLVSLVLTAGFLEVCSNGSDREPTCGEENKEVQRVQMGQLEEMMGPVAYMAVCVEWGSSTSGADPHLDSAS